MSSLSPSAIQLRAIGVPQVSVQGQPAPLALQRAVALLAYLAFHAAPVPRAHLATLLWPDADERVGRTRLRRLLYLTEEALGTGTLATTADTVALAAHAVETDALAFARFARRAVAVPAFDDDAVDEARRWVERARAPLLEGLAFGSEAFEDWRQARSLEHEHLLARLLERLIPELDRRGESAPAMECAQALIGLDPFREPSHVLLMELHARQGHSAGVEAAYARCAELLRAEFGIPPGPATEAAYVRLSGDLRRRAGAPAGPRAIRYAEGEHGAVAYTAFGRGEHTVLVAPGFVCHVEIALEHPRFAAFMDTLAEHFRVILFDRRGVGLSERLSATGTPAAMAADMQAILDDAGIERAWLFGSSEGGLGAMRLALDQPARVEGLCLFGALARGSAAPDYPWAMPAEAYNVWLQRLVAAWGGPAGIETFAPSEQHDPALRAWWARLLRHAASPGGLRAILGGLRDADLRAELARIAVPTLVMHRRDDRAVRFGAGEHLAQAIPGARFLALEGGDHFWWCGDSAAVADALQAFIAKP